VGLPRPHAARDRAGNAIERRDRDRNLRGMRLPRRVRRSFG
jgi:hypothetical protein